MSAIFNRGDVATFSLVSDPSGFFEVVGNEIRVASGAALDFESASSHDVTVRATDGGGLSYDETITLSVTDVEPEDDGGSTRAASISNASFEDAGLSDGAYNQSVPGWVVSGNAGHHNPLASSFGYMTDGESVAYVTPGGSLSQTLSETFSASSSCASMIVPM